MNFSFNVITMTAKNLFLLLALVSTDISWAKRPKQVNATVRFDRTQYSMTLLTNSFVYRDDLQRVSIQEMPCNRVLLLSLVNQYQMFRNQPLRYRARSRSKRNVTLISENGHRYRIERSSAFGVWLREMPKKVQEIKSQAQAACAGA